MISKSEKDKKINNLRIISISATLPNIVDIGEWLNAKYFEFGEEYRPCPLNKIVIGYNNNNNKFLFERNLNYKYIY